MAERSHPQPMDPAVVHPDPWGTQLLPGLDALPVEVSPDAPDETLDDEAGGSRPLVELSPPAARTNRVCACVVHDGMLLLVSRKGGGWTLPGGGVQRGESRRAAVARETLEEAGAVVEVGARGTTVTGTTGTRTSCFPALLARLGPSPEGRETVWADPGQEPWASDPQICQLRDKGLLPTSLL